MSNEQVNQTKLVKEEEKKTMLKTTKSISISGTSSVSVDGTNKIVANFSANISEDGALSSNTYIQDRALYRQYKSEVQEDMTAFDDYVYDLLEA